LHDFHKYPKKHVRIWLFSTQQEDGAEFLAKIHKLVKAVTPVKTGVQVLCYSVSKLDSGSRRNDGERAPMTSQEPAEITLSFMVFVLSLGVNLGKNRLRAKRVVS